MYLHYMFIYHLFYLLQMFYFLHNMFSTGMGSIDNSSEENYSSEDEIVDNDNYNILLTATVGMVTEYYTKYIEKEPCRTSYQTGYKFVSEILHGNPYRCQQQFRMEKHVFINLCMELKIKYGLKASRYIPVEELVSMFLMILGHGFGNRMVQERFQHSGETVSRYFTHVLNAVLRMSKDIISPLDKEFKNIPSKIRDDHRWWPYFKDCIGAIDGTHIPVKISPSKQVPYIGRKGIPTQNVMACCDFDMRFTFVCAGWEGTAHDTRIFLDAIHRKELQFPHPPRGKYYLVDAGYPHMLGYMGPYKGERYHLPDFRRGSQPKGMHEIFNHAHSSLRCTIERTFGCWKSRWRMLSTMPNFSYHKQVQIVVASMAIHNFIRNHAIKDLEFQPYDDNEDLLPSDCLEINEPQEELSAEQSQILGNREMDILRDHIASQLIAR
ncbi:protein ALP1-like isoform X1 [Phoenix dactylifera]|uniref:Protein ALP1-like isoform X1 n=2 Tax=Phoenix dactylifera TaxID=42345 RepID=A0A8B8ZQF5_PHODC|nr:protein ALP1-like isoform X1 [Phoenix dactylifera]